MVTFSWRKAMWEIPLLLLHLIILCEHAVSSEGPPPVLNPKSYTSPSGVYSLHVDPSDMHGRYSATYRFKQSGKTLWSKELPITLWDAGVTDTGMIGGYGYTYGWRGFGNVGIEAGSGSFQVLIMDVNGQVRLKEIKKRESSRFFDTPPNPLANGLMVDGPNDRMVVRVSDPDVNRSIESWWVYSLSAAKALDKLEPAKHMADSKSARFVIDAKPVSGTLLTLVHWWRYEPSRLGARFTLVDRKGKTVWSLELKEDYNVPDNEDAQDELMHFIRKRGAILQADKERSFQLFFAAKSQKVTFSIKQDTSAGWKVSEIGRAPYAATTSTPEPQTIPECTLEPLGKLVLQSPVIDSKSEIHDVTDIELDGEGRIAFLRAVDNEPTFFIVVNQRGKVLRKIPLEVADHREAHWTGHTWVGGDTFIVTRSEYGVGGKAKAWRVDIGTGELEPLPDFDCPRVERLAGFPDGSFVALATLSHKYTLDTTVYGFDATGKRKWALQRDYGETPERLFSPADVAFTSTGKVVVLDRIRHTIQVFDRQGRYLEVIDLKKAWGRKPNYPSGISADTKGGIVVNDFGGSPPYVRMNFDGSVAADFQPKYSDGRVADTRDIRVAPDGRLWTCDGHAILRLKDSGIVDRVLGKPPEVNALGKVAALTIDHRGQIYAVDSRTGAVHVFDKEGRFLHVCKTKPTDFSEELWDPAISVSDKGAVYLSLSDIGGRREGEYLHFSADGIRQGIKHRKTDRWYFQPGTGNGLALDYEQAYLMDSNGKVIRTIARRPDGNWLERPYRAAFNSNGSFAIVAQDSNNISNTINLYERDGAPVRTIHMPSSINFPNIAYDDERLVAGGCGCLVIFDVAGKEIQRFSPKSKDKGNASWHPFFMPDTEELVLFDGSSKTLYRYRMP